MLEAQRGNVTLITAMTSLLMVMIVVLATGIGNQTSQATRMQAASDGAAITAAETYIAVINDEVAFDLIDWGLGFIQRMASMLQQIGRAISAIPYVGPVFGVPIQAVANVIKSVAKNAQNFFKQIKTQINKFLDAAKQVLSTINATMVAANNGYIGFILPTNFLDQASVTKYNLDDIKAITDHALLILDSAHDKADPALISQIYWNALHNIWGGSSKNPPPSLNCGGSGQPACPPTTNEGRGGSDAANRATFHLWPDTPGCTAPTPWTDPLSPPADPTGVQWHRQCDERLWFKEQVQTTYFEQIQLIDDLRFKVNIDQKKEGGSPDRFDGSDQDKADANKAMDDAEAALINIATGTGGETVDQKVRDFTTKLDGYKPSDAPLNHCPKEPTKLGPGGGPTFFGFTCDGQFSAGAPDICKPPPPPDPNAKPPVPAKDPNPCWAYWGWVKEQALPVDKPFDDRLPRDYRNTPYYRDEVQPPNSPKDGSGNLINTLAAWKQFDRPASVMGAEAQTKDVVQDFLMVSEIEPSYMQQLAYHIAGKGDPSADYAITASKAIVHRADSGNDRVEVADLCDFIKNDTNHRDQNGGAVYDRVGGPIPLIQDLPASVFGWCYVLLGFFDTIVNIYRAIHNFFYDNIINPLRNTDIDLGFLGHICLFCWLATIIVKLVDYVLGPRPPDARNWHIALVSVACVPAVSEIANIAGYLVQGKTKVKQLTSKKWDDMLRTVSDTSNLTDFKKSSTCNAPK